MIYDEPRYMPGGDRYMLIEFGNEMNLELNFLAQGLASAIVANHVKGVVETAPCFASMLIHYEPEDISYDDLKQEMGRLIATLGPSDNIELPSRLFSRPRISIRGRRRPSTTTPPRSIRTRNTTRRSWPS